MQKKIIDKDFQKTLDEVGRIGRYYCSPMYCFHIDDKGIIEFRHMSRDDLLGRDESEFVNDLFGVAMFDTKQEALKYLSEEQPAVLRILIAQKPDLADI